jgi:plasmid maintenance system killer protein
MKTLEISKQALYSGVHDVNKKNNGCKIINANHKYKLVFKKSSNSNLPATVEQNSHNSKHLPIGMSVTNEFVKKLKTMDEPDRSDALDMLKKSHFYRKSAEALIEANEAVQILRTSFQL